MIYRKKIQDCINKVIRYNEQEYQEQVEKIEQLRKENKYDERDLRTVSMLSKLVEAKQKNVDIMLIFNKIRLYISNNRVANDVNEYHYWGDIMHSCARIKFYSEFTNENIQEEFTLLKCLQIINCFAEEHGNSYWVDKDFFEQIKTNNSITNKLTLNIPCGLFLFPSELSPRSPFSNKPIDWVAFSYVKRGIKPSPIKVKNEVINLQVNDSDSIIWTTVDRGDDNYDNIFTGTILLDTLKTVIDNNHKLSKQEKVVIEDISNLVIQSLAYAENPEIEYVESGLGFGNHQKHKASSKVKRFINPKWIGRGVKVYSPHAATIPLGGTHNSPIPHQRRGYTRRQPCGPGRKEIRLVEIPATIVNKDKSHDTELINNNY